MFRHTTAGLALLTLLAGTQARAGVYLPAEEPVLVPVEDGQARPMPVSEFQNVVYPTIRSLGLPTPRDPQGTPQTKLYRQRRDALLQKGVANLSADEVISLSGYQIRLRDLPGAEATLVTARQRYRDRFEVYANLAVVYFQTNRVDEALRNQALVIDLMKSAHLPANLPRDWLLKAERKERELFRIRYADPTAGRRADHLDALFPEDAFSKPEARAEATALTQQLLFWLPDDTRLYWLLGELYRAAEDWSAAAKIFDDCVDARGFSPPLLKDHRREVKTKLAEQAQESAVPTAPVAPAADAPRSDAPGGWLPTNGRLFVVGAAGAALLLALGYFQWREMRRRWRSGAPRSTH